MGFNQMLSNELLDCLQKESTVGGNTPTRSKTQFTVYCFVGLDMPGLHQGSEFFPFFDEYTRANATLKLHYSFFSADCLFAKMKTFLITACFYLT
jgi:hypothetical protein